MYTKRKVLGVMQILGCIVEDKIEDAAAQPLFVEFWSVFVFFLSK